MEPEMASIPDSGTLMEGTDALSDPSPLDALAAGQAADFVQMPVADHQAALAHMDNLTKELNNTAAALNDLAIKRIQRIGALRLALKATQLAAIDEKYASVASAIKENKGIDREQMDELEEYYTELKVASMTAPPPSVASVPTVTFDRTIYERPMTTRLGVGVAAEVPQVASTRLGVPAEAPKAPVIGTGLASLTAFEKTSSRFVPPTQYKETIGVYAPISPLPFHQELVRCAAATTSDIRANNSRDHHDLFVPDVATIASLWEQWFHLNSAVKPAADTIASVFASIADELARTNISELANRTWASELTITARG